MGSASPNMPARQYGAHDTYQRHLMKFAGLLHEMSSRDLTDATNLFAVQQVVSQINSTVDLLTGVRHTPAEPLSAEIEDGVHIPG